MGGLTFKGVSKLLPGVSYCVVIALVSLATWRVYNPISSLMWAFIYSIVVANVVDLPDGLLPGMGFCSSRLLKGTIALLGLVTSAVIWFQVGVGVVNALVIIFFAFFASIWLGRRVGLSDRLALLIGVGTSICGASAIAATAPAIEAKEEEIGLAIAGITLFGLFSMFLYPFLFTRTIVCHWLYDNLNVYAVWVGSGVHETAQVIAAAGVLGQGVIRPAMLIKSVRIFMIGPAVLAATFIYNKRGSGSSKPTARFVLPLFGVAFIANSVLCALLDANASRLAAYGLNWTLLKASLSGVVLPFLLSTAFAGVGSKVKFRTIAKLGAKPFAFAALIAVSTGALALALAILVAPLIP